MISSDRTELNRNSVSTATSIFWPQRSQENYFLIFKCLIITLFEVLGVDFINFITEK